MPDDAAFRVLFVGVRAYTWRLTHSRRRSTVVTIDRDPWMRPFGNARHHVLSIEDLAQARETPFDVAFVNGVIGAGLDSVDATDRALRAIRHSLRPGGVLVIGLNEERPTTPDLEKVDALGLFRPIAPPPFGVHRYVVTSPFEGSHTFLFFERA